jgi:hypothetical protein
LRDGIERRPLDADALLSGSCRLLYERQGTYEEVARRTRLDRRTVKAYLEKKPVQRRLCRAPIGLGKPKSEAGLRIVCFQPGLHPQNV